MSVLNAGGGGKTSNVLLPLFQKKQTNKALNWVDLWYYERLKAGGGGVKGKIYR